MNRATLLCGSALAALCCVIGTATADMTSAPATLEQWAEGAQLFDGLGNFHRGVTTSSKEAQAYFDQGMRLLWAFNHDESSRSFARAAQLDPTCAMCFWGVALTVGPNYNLPMMAERRAKVAWQALQQAKANASRTAPVEQAMIAALGARYPDAKPLDPSNEGPVLSAYAKAMQGVAQQFPDDSDVQTLTAEALMNINAWKLWALDGAPAPGTEEIVARLQGVLAKDPQHPGANHYYIHAVEASSHPENAVPISRAAPWHDAGRRSPRAHAGAYHAACRPLRRRGHGESQGCGSGRGIFRLHDAAGLLRDVHRAQLRVPGLFHGNARPQGRHAGCSAEGTCRHIG